MENYIFILQRQDYIVTPNAMSMFFDYFRVACFNTLFGNCAKITTFYSFICIDNIQLSSIEHLYLHTIIIYFSNFFNPLWQNIPTFRSFRLISTFPTKCKPSSCTIIHNFAHSPYSHPL